MREEEDSMVSFFFFENIEQKWSSFCGWVDGKDGGREDS